MKMGVTGHRPQKLGRGWGDHAFHTVVKGYIREALENFDPEIVLLGMALGVDQWTAEICRRRNIPFIAALPFKDQDTKWTPQIRQRYQWLLSKAAEVVVVDRVPGYISSFAPPDVYHYKKMGERNRWIVDQLGLGDMLLGIRNFNVRGGTHNCIMHARSKIPEVRPTVVELNPDKWPEYKPKIVEAIMDDDVPF